MEQFSLEKYLENPSRKVVTRDERDVRIICTDRKTSNSTNVIGLAKNPYDVEQLLVCNTDGQDVYKENQNDLFFADDDELTEFENKLFSVISEIWQNYLLGREIDIAETVKEYSPELLDLARKELQPEIDKELDKAYKTQDIVVFCNGYAQGKQDTLKVAFGTLPKWKKATENKEFDKHILLFQDEESIVLTTEIYKGEYYIEEDDLKTLPKED